MTDRDRPSGKDARAGATIDDTPYVPTEDDLATRAAWLYHAGGLTQSQVAAQLGIASVKAHRLIARATRAGRVRVFVEGPIGGCIAHEAGLMRAYGLNFCRVVPALPDAGDAERRLPVRALGIAAAGFLLDVLERGAHTLIGLGHGRTLAAMVDHLPRLAAPNTCFVSLLGGLPRRTGTNAFEVIHRLAEKTGAEAYLLPVPVFANAASDRRIMLAQRGVAETLDMAARATLFLLGIGEVGGNAFLPTAGLFTEEDVSDLLRAGAVGEILGRYLDVNGRLANTALHDRVIAAQPTAMSGRDVIAVAGGEAKTVAIRSVLRSGMLTGLITDEPTARRLLDADIRAEQEGNEEWTRKPRTSAGNSSRGGSGAGS